MIKADHILQLQTVKKALPQWGLSPDAEIKLLTISENATFLVRDADQCRIIRIYRPDYHSDQEIRSELVWMQAIEQSNIVPVPHLYPTQLGQLFAVCHGKRLACFSFMKGYEPQSDENLIPWFFQLGKISAGLHKQVHSWLQPSGFIRKVWTYETMVGENAIWGHWRDAQGLDQQDLDILQQCKTALKHISHYFPKDRQHFGLIHGDLRLANLLVDQDHLVAIDFDDCGFSWFGLDLANAISFIEDDPIVPQLLQSWFNGYETVAKPSPTMRKMIPHLIMMRRLQLTAWLASHHETETAQKLGIAYNKATVKLAKNYLSKATPLINDR